MDGLQHQSPQDRHLGSHDSHLVCYLRSRAYSLQSSWQAKQKNCFGYKEQNCFNHSWSRLLLHVGQGLPYGRIQVLKHLFLASLTPNLKPSSFCFHCHTAFMISWLVCISNLLMLGLSSTTLFVSSDSVQLFFKAMEPLMHSEV